MISTSLFACLFIRISFINIIDGPANKGTTEPW